MLKKLYAKSEIWFAVAWIIAYVVLASAGDNISADLGIGKIVTLPILIVLSTTLYFFVRKNGLAEKYGLCKPRIPAAKMLYYAPLLVLLTANLWYGVAMNLSVLETVLYVLSMFCVGFLEELIFRGRSAVQSVAGGVRGGHRLCLRDDLCEKQEPDALHHRAQRFQRTQRLCQRGRHDTPAGDHFRHPAGGDRRGYALYLALAVKEETVKGRTGR